MASLKDQLSNKKGVSAYPNAGIYTNPGLGLVGVPTPTNPTIKLKSGPVGIIHQYTDPTDGQVYHLVPSGPTSGSYVPGPMPTPTTNPIQPKVIAAYPSASGGGIGVAASPSYNNLYGLNGYMGPSSTPTPTTTSTTIPQNLSNKSGGGGGGYHSDVGKGTAASGVAGALLGGLLGAPFGPIGMAGGAALGGSIGAGAGNQSFKTKAGKKLAQQSSGGSSNGGVNNNSSTPASTWFKDQTLLQSITSKDILSGSWDTSNINIDDNDKDWSKFKKNNPQLARAVQARQDYEWQNMLNTMQSGGGQEESLSPLAVQLLYQQNINPFLQGVTDSLKNSANQYEGLMSQLTSTLPEPYKRVMAANAPVQANLMRQVADANAVSLVDSPRVSALQDIIGKDYAAREANLLTQRINQQLAAQGGTSGSGIDISQFLQ